MESPVLVCTAAGAQVPATTISRPSEPGSHPVCDLSACMVPTPTSALHVLPAVICQQPRIGPRKHAQHQPPVLGCHPHPQVLQKGELYFLGIPASCSWSPCSDWVMSPSLTGSWGHAVDVPPGGLRGPPRVNPLACLGFELTKKRDGRMAERAGVAAVPVTLVMGRAGPGELAGVCRQGVCAEPGVALQTCAVQLMPDGQQWAACTHRVLLTDLATWPRAV